MLEGPICYRPDAFVWWSINIFYYKKKHLYKELGLQDNYRSKNTETQQNQKTNDQINIIIVIFIRVYIKNQVKHLGL